MYSQTVEELMTGVTGVDFVQPWYTCVPTNKCNTGMALGGIGSVITATPAGTTPFFHFYNGCGIENNGEKPIELNNFFYGECVSNDLELEVRSPSFFCEDILAFPLFDHDGKKYFDGSEDQTTWKSILTRIVNCSSFISDNLESLENWGFMEAERNGTLYHAYRDQDFRHRNFAFLLNIFSFSLTRKIEFTRSLIADVTQKYRLYKKGYPSDRMLYEFQYPLSATHYKEETQRCALKKVHITPVCPSNETLSSLPLYMTAFHVGNPTQQAMDVTLALCVENFIGYDLIKTRTGVQDALLHIQRSFKDQKTENFVTNLEDKKIHGLIYRQDESARKGDISGELCFAILTKDCDQMLVTHKSNFYIGSEANVVESAIATGKIYEHLDDAVTFSKREPVSSALCISFRLEPGQYKAFEMATVLDIPDVKLGEYRSQKKYTEYFPETLNRSKTIAEYFFKNRSNIHTSEWIWRESTHHKTILESGILSSSAAGKLRQMLLDNHSFLAESSVWDANNKFLIRECVDYPFFNSLDVYFYGSFGLLKLFPEIDNRIIREFSESVLSEDTSNKLFGAFVRFKDERISKSLHGVRKVLGSTPHDMGTPFDFEPNAYSWKDVALWVDLAPKFVLLVYRNYLITRDRSLLEDTWPAVQLTLEYINAKFMNGEGSLPISVGYANTFDNLRGDGVCVYSASLWLASLTVAAEIAKTLGSKDTEKMYLEKLHLGKQQMQSSLWDEAGSTYLYSIVPIRALHIHSDIFELYKSNGNSALNEVLAQLALNGLETQELESLSLNRFIFLLNNFIDRDTCVLPSNVWQSLLNLNNVTSVTWQKLTKMERRACKKRYLKSQLVELFIDDFETQLIEPECDFIFANQLCADTYLYYLGLPMITTQAQCKKVLSTILSKNMNASNYRIGACNMVARDGKDLESFQAQDIWVGVQYSIASALIATGMIREFEDLAEALFDAIYDKAKIPFGVPEGFNCVGLFIAEDFIRMGINEPELRTKLMKFLLKKNIVLAGNRVNFEMLEDADQFNEIWSDETNLFKDTLKGEEVYELLLATKLKYTAGRYFRAGMIHMIPEVLRRYKNSVDGLFDEDESLYLSMVSQAKAGSAVAGLAKDISYAD